MNPATKRKLLVLLSFLGPGWIVMIADVDAPSVFTAIVAGAQYKYEFIGILFLLIIPLYLFQESAARLGIYTKKGLAELIKEKYGNFWAFTIVGSMFFVNMLAYTAEFAGVSAAALIFGVPIEMSLILLIFGHTIIVLTGSYKKVENILIVISMILFAFIVTAFIVKPNPAEIITGLNPVGDFTNLGYLTILLGIVGAVIMPWMLFYQQAAVVDKKITLSELKSERKGTILGAIVSEILMVSIVITAGTTLFGKINDSASIMNIASIIEPISGKYSPYLFAIAVIAAGFLAGVVVSLSSAWSFAEYFKWEKSLNHKISHAKGFYLVYIIEVLPGIFIPLFYKHLIDIVINAMVLNTIILPLPLVFLVLLSSNKKLMHVYVNEIWRKTLMWFCIILILISSILYLAIQLSS